SGAVIPGKKRALDFDEAKLPTRRRPLERNRIVVGETRVTETLAAAFASDCAPEPLWAEVAERVRLDELGDLFDALPGSHELRARGRIDAVVARAAHRWRRDPYMHFLCTRSSQQPHDLP